MEAGTPAIAANKTAVLEAILVWGKSWSQPQYQKIDNKLKNHKALRAAPFGFYSFSIYLQDLVRQVFTMLILTVAAAEAAVGIAIIVIYYKNKGSIHVDQVNSLKG